MPPFFTKRFIIGAAVLLLIAGVLGSFAYGLQPTSADAAATPVLFEVTQGEGFHEIINRLRDARLIRSSIAAEVFSLLTGSALSLQPGLYRLNAAMSAPEILGELTSGSGKEVVVTIPEGSNLYQIDARLSDALVTPRGGLVNFHDKGNLEGKLFPDTYRFFVGSDVKEVVQKLLDNFNAKAAPLLVGDKANAERNLTLASIVEKEVPNAHDQKIVAGILLKRLAAHVPLQADATVCYAMQQKAPLSPPDCATLDLNIDSPYNTYLYKGLPPGPIGNPGISAIQAAISSESSPYWYYLSDPKTGKTIFSKTLDEQHQNTVKYLEGD